MSAVVCVGRVLGVHGLKGLLKVQSFTKPPEALFDYTCCDERGEAPVTFDPSALSRRGTYQGYPFYLARVKGCEDRTQAEALKGLKFYVSRETLPSLPQDDFYHHDLKGLRVIDEAGDDVGKVLGVHNFGAGDMLEIVPRKGPSFFVRFVRDHVMDVDMALGTVTLSKGALVMRDALNPLPKD